LARSGHGPFSLIRHVGRKSGHIYETPGILVRVEAGFIAELTYGENVNWYRNIVAAGGRAVVHHGREYRVTGIEACSAEPGRSAYPELFRLVLKATRREEFRLLRTESAATGRGVPPPNRTGSPVACSWVPPCPSGRALMSRLRHLGSSALHVPVGRILAWSRGSIAPVVLHQAFGQGPFRSRTAAVAPRQSGRLRPQWRPWS
jgi:hypothetical protein